MSRRTFGVLTSIDRLAASYLLYQLRRMGFSVRVLKPGRGLGRFLAYVCKSNRVAAKAYEGFAFC